jgi:hypothetical protein
VEESFQILSGCKVFTSEFDMIDEKASNKNHCQERINDNKQRDNQVNKRDCDLGAMIKSFNLFLVNFTLF